MAQYDPNVLQHYADRLYARAAWIVVKFGFVGALIGAMLAAAPAVIVAHREADVRAQAIIDHYKGTGNGFDVPPMPTPENGTSPVPVLIIVGVVFGGVVGALVGHRKDFQLRLQAQLTLCQMQIEWNTRRPQS